MKATTLIVLGGLMFAGTALAAEPQQQATGTSLKIAIDPVTGKRRALTTEESAALDAQAAASNSLRAKGAKAKASALPGTMDQALQNTRVVNGIVGFRAPMDSMSSVTVTRNADGTLTFAEDGEAQPAPQARESARE